MEKEGEKEENNKKNKEKREGTFEKRDIDKKGETVSYHSKRREDYIVVSLLWSVVVVMVGRRAIM